ncbi:prefoldin subunit 4 [Loa loa]|nr:prefoldin subunit 4 [Loa loa]EFO19751.1 prefoldin subunit 4 [Loa loa]
MAAGTVKQNIHVNAEDQKLINRFARLHQRSLDVKERLQETSRDLQNLNDAADELLLLDDADAQSVPFKIGSVFMHMDQERLNEKFENVKGELENRVADLTQKHKKICDEMDSLKSILYGKFGESINLETDTDNQ